MLLALAAGITGAAAKADEAALLRDFTVCSGRLSAQMEHQWLMSDPGSDHTAALRSGMIALAEAVTPPGREAAAMAMRIEAKVAQAALLARARDPSGGAAAAQAARRSAELIDACTALLTGRAGA